MKYATLLAVAALGLASLLLPRPETPLPAAELGVERPPISICPLVQIGELTTEVSILSNVVGEGRVTAFSSGPTNGSLAFDTGNSASVRIQASDASAIGTGGGLIELPSELTAAGVTLSSPRVRAAEACTGTPTPLVHVIGGSTAGESTFDVVLLNPYAGEAVASLVVTSEAGIESDARFDSVIVPSLSTITLDFKELIPGRATISATIETERGSLLAVAQRSEGGDRALWRAVAPELDWWVVAPSDIGDRTLLIGNPEAVEAEYQIDLYGPDGFVEGYETGTIPARTHLRVPIDEISDKAVGFRVISASPVVVGLEASANGALARTSGSPIGGSSWLLPGASNPPGGRSSITVLNSGIEPVTVTFRSMRDDSHTQTVELDAEALAEITLVDADGYRIDATGPVVAVWSASIEASTALSSGVVVEDG